MLLPILVILALLLVGVFFLLAAGAIFEKSKRDEGVSATSLGILSLFASLLLTFSMGYNYGVSKSGLASTELAAGDIYTLLTDSPKDGDEFYAIIKTDAKRILAVRFKDQPAKRAVVAKDGEGKIIFVPIFSSDEKSGEKK